MFIIKRWPRKESRKNCLTSRRTHLPTAQLDPLRTTNSIGKPPSSVLMIAPMLEESSSLTFTSPLITHSDLPNATSSPKFTTPTSTPTDPSASTFSRINGHPHSPSPRFFFQSPHFSLTQTLMILLFPKLLNFTRATAQNSRQLLKNGQRNTHNDHINIILL